MKTLTQTCDYCGAKGTSEIAANFKIILLISGVEIKIVGRDHYGNTIKACPSCLKK